MSKQPTLDPAEVIASDLGRGAFPRFKDELADAPDELARFVRVADDPRRGRARGWLAESRLRVTVPAAPVAPESRDLHRRP
jgi:hypothetical protein